jgi:hypothetical protein
MKRLGELFEVLATVVKQDGAADVDLEVDNPDDQCVFLQALQQHYGERLVRVWRRMPFVLRITEWKEMPVPVLVVKERHNANGTNTSSAAQKQTSAAAPQQTPSLLTPDTQGRSSQGNLVERGHLAGAA